MRDDMNIPKLIDSLPDSRPHGTPDLLRTARMSVKGASRKFTNRLRGVKRGGTRK